MKILTKVFSAFEEYEVVKVKNYKLVKKIEIIDVDSKNLDRYKKLSMHEMARKATVIFLFNPALLALKVSFNVLQIVFDCSSYFLSWFTMGKALADARILKIFEIAITSRVDFFKNIAQDIIYIIRAPFFLLLFKMEPFSILLLRIGGGKLMLKFKKIGNKIMNFFMDYRINKTLKKNSF